MTRRTKRAEAKDAIGATTSKIGNLLPSMGSSAMERRKKTDE
jgi:hypothetical protein